MKIVFVTAGYGSGLESTANPDKLLDYAGEATRFTRRNIDA
jgi:hypothetical protein